MVDERRLELNTLRRNGDIFGNCLGLLRLVLPCRGTLSAVRHTPAAESIITPCDGTPNVCFVDCAMFCISNTSASCCGVSQLSRNAHARSLCTTTNMKIKNMVNQVVTTVA